MLGSEQMDSVMPVIMSTKQPVHLLEKQGECSRSAHMTQSQTLLSSLQTELQSKPSSTAGEKPKNPVLVPSYVPLESLENRAPVSQTLVVTKEQLAGFNEVLKTFREQDYFHIHAQKLRNTKMKKAAENLAKHN